MQKVAGDIDMTWKINGNLATLTHFEQILTRVFRRVELVNNATCPCLKGPLPDVLILVDNSRSNVNHGFPNYNLSILFYRNILPFLLQPFEILQ